MIEKFNKTLKVLKDSFHKYGKFSDSNSKLDEIVKLFAIYYYDKKINKESEIIKPLLNEYKNEKIGFVNRLNIVFKNIVERKEFRLNSGESIFGQNPFLNIEMDDDYFSFNVLKLIEETYNGFENRVEEFDFLNELFGHFVRDNFRNNIEDAQYLTPQEVVDFMCDIALEATKGQMITKICDPCSGVGSFLSIFGSQTNSKKPIQLIAQDKVPRMARMTKLSLNVLENVKSIVSVGNSLIGKSEIDNHSGEIDLILTNPPFGARFNRLELIGEDNQHYPLLNDLFYSVNHINSEVLFVDRCLGLLKEGGHLFAILPDSVISSSGVQEILRHRIVTSNNFFVQSIIELPIETFAQAGTRTKTSILHIIKNPVIAPKSIFFASSMDLGFEVSTRKGVTVKKKKGKNDLPIIQKSFDNFLSDNIAQSDSVIYSEKPSCVAIENERIFQEPWTPNYYNASKLVSLNKYRKKEGFDLLPIGELAEIITKQRKKERKSKDSKCISILHVVNEDLLDYEELLKYNPKYKGPVCKPGDILISKINPRIHRVLVVPDLKFPLTCSSEFEILTTKSEYSNFEIKFLLGLPFVQNQIIHLTSGTSSSHNRIKTEDILKINTHPSKKYKELYRFPRGT